MCAQRTARAVAFETARSQPASTSPLIAEDLARFVGGFSADAIPVAVVARAKHLILDAVGIALASTTYDFARRAMTAIAALAGTGDTAVIGMPARLPMRDAALVNGILIHGLDFDDTHTGGVIHATSLALDALADARALADGLTLA